MTIGKANENENEDSRDNILNYFDFVLEIRITRKYASKVNRITEKCSRKAAKNTKKYFLLIRVANNRTWYVFFKRKQKTMHSAVVGVFRVFGFGGAVGIASSRRLRSDNRKRFFAMSKPAVSTEIRRTVMAEVILRERHRSNTRLMRSTNSTATPRPPGRHVVSSTVKIAVGWPAPRERV